MTSGTRQGGRPTFFYFGLRKLRQKPLRVRCLQGCRVESRHAAGRGGFGRRCPENPIWHGALRPSCLQEWQADPVAWNVAWRQRREICASICRAGRCEAPPRTRAGASPTSGCKGIYRPRRPQRRQSEPDGQGFRGGYEHERRARARHRRLHLAERSGKSPQERYRRLRDCLARQSPVEREGRRGMGEARALRNPPRARDAGGHRASRSQIDTATCRERR